MELVAITHDLLGDPFWDPFIAGLSDGSRDTGCTVRHLRPPTYSVNSLLRLIEEALDLRPSGLITTLPAPEQQHEILQQAINGGLAVGVLNTFDRRPVVQRLVTVFRVGADDYAGGRTAAAHMLALDAHGPALVLDHYRVPNTCHAARIEGFVDRMNEGGSSAEVVAIDTLDARTSDQLAEVLDSREFASVLSLGPPGFDLISASIKHHPKPPRHITFDATPRSLASMAADELVGIIDCQPWLQGYLGVVLMTQHLRRNCSPVADVLTGPRLLLP